MQDILTGLFFMGSGIVLIIILLLIGLFIDTIATKIMKAYRRKKYERILYTK